MIKYLGISLGPEAYANIWKEVSSGYCEIVDFLRSTDGGLGIALYNVLGASKCSWVGSFVAPSTDMLAIKAASLQRLLRCPWNVATVSLLHNLKTIGFPLEFQSLTNNSLAARARNGLSTISNFSSSYETVQTFMLDDGRVLNVIDPDWLQNSCLFQIKRAIDTTRRAGQS